MFSEMPAKERSRPKNVFGVMAEMAGLLSVAAYLARHDQLTGLLNKESFKHEIDERLRTKKPFGVVFMDMDGFKRVNDSLGHEEGERVLAHFGQCLKSNFRRESDVLTHEKLLQKPGADNSVGRYGGDEFGLIVDLRPVDGTDRRSSAERMEGAASHLRSTLDEFVARQPANVQACGFNVSLGYAVRETGEETTVSDLIRTADQAMYQDKESRRPQQAISS